MLLSSSVGILPSSSSSSPTPFSSFPISVNTPTRCRLTLFRLYFTSITATAAPNPIPQKNDLMVDYLVDSLGFSRREAISASTKVNHLKSTKKPDLVFNLFLKYGLDKTQIRKIISSSPKILLHKVDQTLEPKIKVLIDIGFSGSDFVKFIKKNPGVLSRGLDTCIIPTINYLKQILGSDGKVVYSIRESPWLLSSPSVLKRMQLNVLMLRNDGLSDEYIRKYITTNPRNLLQKPNCRKQ